MIEGLPDDPIPQRVRACLWFIPGSISFLLLEVCTHGTQAFFMFLLLSAFPLATAARFWELTGRNPLSYAVERGVNQFLSLLFFLIILVIFAVPGLAYLLMKYQANPDITDVELERIFYLAVALPMLLPLMRLWPVFTVSFTALPSEGSLTWRGQWVGPGLVAAWRQTGQRGALISATVPFFLISIPLIAIPMLAGQFAIIRFFYYFILIPAWSLGSVKLGNRLHVRWRTSRPAEQG